jgi:uncharacterized repeat protein (TIGR02543 family)
MDITLTAITAAVVTACFITAGVKDEAPVFPISVSSEAVVSAYIPKTDEAENTLNSLLTTGFVSVYTKNSNPNSLINTTNSNTVLTIEKVEQVRYKTNIVQTVAEVAVYSKYTQFNNISQTVGSEAHISAGISSYTFSLLDAYFKHATNTYPYYVTGWYNKTLVFGSYLNIDIISVKEMVTSEATVNMYFLMSIPQQTHTLTVWSGMSAFAKVVNQTGLLNETLTTVFITTPSNINPYRTTDQHVENLQTTQVISTPAPKDIRPNELLNTTTVTLGNISYFLIDGVEALHTVSSSLGSISVVYGQNIVTSEYMANTASTEAVMGVMPWKRAEGLVTCDSNYNLTLYIKDLESTEHLNSVVSTSAINVFFISPYIAVEDTVSAGDITLYIKDGIYNEALNEASTHGQSDMIVGEDRFLSRTESLYTNLGDANFLMTPGLDDPVENTVTSNAFVTLVYGSNKENTDSVNTLTTLNVTTLLIQRMISPDNTETLNSTFGLTIYIKEKDSTDNLNTLSSSIYTEIIRSRATSATHSVVVDFGASPVVKNSNASLLSNTVHTNYAASVDYEDPREITDVIETLTTSVEILMFFINGVTALHTLVNTVDNIQIRVKDIEESRTHVIVTEYAIELYVNRSTHNIEQTVTSLNVTGIVPSKIAYVGNETITDFLVSTHYEANLASGLETSVSTSLGIITLVNSLRAEVPATTHSLETNYGIQLTVDRVDSNSLNNTETALGSLVFVVGADKASTGNVDTANTTVFVTLYKDTMFDGTIQTVSTEATVAMYMKDVNNAEAINTVITNTQSDMRSGNVLQISRTETISTLLGALSYVRNPGFLPVEQTINTASESITYAKDSLAEAESTNNIGYNATNYGWVNSGAQSLNTNETDVSRPFEHTNLVIYSNSVTTVGSIMFGMSIKTVASSTTYTLSIWFRQNRAGCSAPYVRTSVNNNSLGNFTYNGNPNSVNWPVNEWIRIQGTATTQANETGLYLSNYIGTQVGDKVWYYGYQIEQRAHRTTYVYGSRTGVAEQPLTALGNIEFMKDLAVETSLNTVSTTSVCDIMVEDIPLTGVSNSTSTTADTQISFKYSIVNDALNTTTTALGDMQLDVVHPVTITLNKQAGTGGTDSIVTVAGFSITPASVVIPTRTHYTFNGYYTLASGGVQIINNVGTYVALTNSTYTSDVTLYAQWTAVLYTITWYRYGQSGETYAKRENLVAGATSTAPSGTTDTAQYDYEWPKASTVVSGNESITETRTIKAYTVTWYRYGQNGETYAKRETLTYGSVSTAPTGTSNTTQYTYTWPKSSTTVVGTENITETRTTNQYTVTWYLYGQTGETYAKRETLNYGATSNAPIGTTDTAQYDYAWPKSSTTVVGTENITETRTLLSYTITWYRFGQSGETYAKRETLTYGSTSNAPAGTADTTQWDYSWPKTFTTVTGTESITETRIVIQYTITWKFYSGSNALVETLDYGAVSTAPLGTLDTTEWDYSWPKANTTVVGTETINETRAAKSYTLTFEGNGATPSPTSKAVTWNSTYGTLAVVSKTNWEFLGWYNNFDTHETPNIIAHWPLDGNLNDVSGNRITGTLQGATVDGAGKIGSAYSFANTRIHTVDFNSYLSGNNYTYCAWINRSSSQNEFNMFMGQGLPYFSFRAGGQLYWSNSVNGTQRTVITSETYSNNIWYHFAATYDGTYMKIFVNGVEKASSSQPGTMSPGWEVPFSIGDGRNSNWYPFYGKVNDVRIYNTVLTIDQIKEVAQAKIMHYNFDVCGEPTTNLSSGIQPLFSAWGTPAVTGSSSYVTLANGKEAIYMTSVYSGSGGVQWRRTNNGSLISVSPSTAYTMSAMIKYTGANPSANLFYLRQYRSDGSQIQENGWYSSSFRDTLSDGWYYAYRTVTLHAECINVRLESYEYSTNEIWMYDFQFEQKNAATPYTPTSREGLIIDSSPYKRHATMTTNYPTWTTTQNANGRASYLFNYTNQDYIALPYFKTDIQAVTLSAWMRSNDISRAQNIISRNGPFFLRVTNSTLRVGIYTGTWVFANGATTLLSNVWYHLVLTYDGVRVKGYVNGVLDIDVAKTGDMVSWAGTIRLGYTTGGEDAPMDGYIDDVRIYATALSQADITLLYNTQTLITSGTTVRTSKDHIAYAHWNPTSVSGLTNTTETTTQSDIRSGNILQISRTETVVTALGDMQYENQTVFNITLDRQGGTGGTSTITGSTGIEIIPTSITPPTWTNYTFTGYWTATSGGTRYINVDGSYNNLNSNTFVGNVILYAQWNMNQVYFDWNPTPNTIGLTATVSIDGAAQQTNSLDWYQLRPANSVFKISTLGIPLGWQYSSYTTTRLVSVTTAGSGSTTEVQGTGDMTQTAARAIAVTVVGISYSITVNQGSGSGSSASISTYQPNTTGYTITMTRGTRADFRFWKWTVSGANGQATVNGDTITIPAYTTSVQPYGALTITADWLTAIATGLLNTTSTVLGDAQYDIATPFTITLDRQSGSGGTASITCVNGFYLDPTSATVPTRNGYTFGGYYTGTGGTGTQRINASGTYVALTNTTYSSAVTLYAQWSVITYTLTNDRNSGTGGNNSATYNITTSSTIATLFGAVTRTGYTLSNWRWTSATAGGWVNATNYAGSTNVSGRYATGTLQAQWTANTYTVTFNSNGGGTPSPTSKSVTYASTYEILATVSRTDWVFTGWYTASTGGTLIQSSTTVTITAAQTLYAHWTPTLASATNETVTALGDMQTEYTSPTYNITTSSGTGVASMSVSPTTYQQSGSSQNVTITRSASTGYSLNVATITRLGDFGGSTPTVSGTTVTIPADSYGDFRVNQTATPNSFEIALDPNGGTAASNNAISVTYATSIEAFNTNMLATRTGHTTTGYWTATSGGTQRTSASAYTALTSTTYTSAVTLYAQWTANSYTVTFNANGGNTPSPTSKSVTYGSTYGTLATCTRTGYTLTGWWTASSGGTQITSGTAVTITAAQTLYAQWTADSFVITLNANGGTTASNSGIDVTYATSIEAFTTTMRPTRANNLFKGYYTATSGGTQRISPTAYVALTNTTYASAATLYAQWDSAPNFPTVRASTSGALSTAALTLTVTLPTGHASGDLLIIGVSLDGSRAMTAPTGWTLLADPTNTTANRHAVWYKTRGATESNPAITWLTTTEIGTWYSVAITTGTWSGTPEVATAYGSSTTPNPPALTPTWGYAKTLWLALNGWDYNRTSTTVTTNYTLMTYQAGSSTASAGHRTFQRSVEAATEDPGTITISSTDTWYAHTVGIKPAISGGVTSTPTITSVYCLDDTFDKYIYAEVTNNEASSVTIYNHGSSQGTWTTGQTKSFLVATGVNIPYAYNLSVTALASGKTESSAATSSGNVSMCSFM